MSDKLSIPCVIILMQLMQSNGIDLFVKVMKKTVSLLAMATVLTVSMASTAFAHGHGRSKARATNYSICTIESCAKTGLHAHNSRTYRSHYYGDGHDYHEYCDIANCELLGYHEHDGTYHFAHTANDGHRGCGIWSSHH